ncbi:MAG: type II secretion system protein GspG [Verrucomicrobiota bacterium]
MMGGTVHELNSGREAATRASIRNISTAIRMYEIDTGALPESLSNLVRNPGLRGWHGPYLKGGVAKDAWGGSFYYQRNGMSDDSWPEADNSSSNEPASGKNFVLRSAGADRVFGTSDDISS